MSKKIALLSLPWHPFNFLSIQLGTLTSTLREAKEDVSTFHYYKDFIEYIPQDLYEKLHAFSQGEAIFAALFFPRRIPKIKEVLENVVGDINLSEITRSCEKYINDILNQQDWEKFQIVGFTITHEQLMASLCLAKLMKEKYPKIHILFGGAILNQMTGKGLLNSFTFIDSAAYGEGENTLKELTERIFSNSDDLSDIPGVIFRKKREIVINEPRELVKSLDELPVPDYSDFHSYELVDGSSSVVPHIPFETSRGCFWGKCVFCNLDQQWHGKARIKNVNRLASEVKYQVEKYKSSQILFTDTNISNSIDALHELSKLGLDLNIFAEVSGHDISYKSMKILRKAGVRVIQVGIEAFNENLLKRYGKGVGLMRNMEMLKWCLELGIEVGYNIVIKYPDETANDVKETLNTMKYASIFQPPFLINYSLAYYSDAYYNLEQHNVKGIDLPPEYKSIYPQSFLKECSPLVAICVIPVPKKDKRTNWKPVQRFVKKWHKKWNGSHFKPQLYWRDGETFLLVEERDERRMVKDSWCLTGDHRELYLLCDKESQSLEELEKNMNINRKSIKGIVDELQNEGLLYSTDGRALSLAIHST